MEDRDRATYDAVSALAVSRRFIEAAAAQARTLTPMQLLKLVYIAHGWSLGFFDRKLIRQRVEAWRYGPVIREVYQAVKGYGGNAISPAYAQVLPVLPPDEERDALLTSVYENYKDYSGPELSTMTHRAGTPWDITWNVLRGSGEQDAVIDSMLIRDHYRQIGGISAKNA